ncbi:hypothetical protein NM688_g7048 [Phlebia brevispora]|uniref:Uncharacterized protein n=1 Tax=Phlebia brevispora TaxID=194682 RepID=A0ACC1S9K6_9APHY|nr:hypothetical protein NM688_g7048 [Phlebia brevispora]
MASNAQPEVIQLVPWQEGTSCFAAMIWIAYDVIIHLDIECIWRQRSWVQWLYIFIRYAPILHETVLHPLLTVQFSIKACRSFIAYQFGFMLALTILVDAVLLMRVFALYNENRFIARLLVTLYVVQNVVSIVLLAIVVPRQTFTSSCEIESSPRIFVAYWLTSLMFETILFVMTLVKFFQNSYITWQRESMLYIFFRDGTWAFAIIFVSILLNTLMYQINNNPRSGVVYTWMCSVLSFSGSHILLNIRRLGADDSDLATTTTHFTAIAFGASPTDCFSQTTEESAEVSTFAGDTIAGDLPDVGDLHDLTPPARHASGCKVEV